MPETLILFPVETLPWAASPLNLSLIWFAHSYAVLLLHLLEPPGSSTTWLLWFTKDQNQNHMDGDHLWDAPCKHVPSYMCITLTCRWNSLLNIHRAEMLKIASYTSWLKRNFMTMKMTKIIKNQVWPQMASITLVLQSVNLFTGPEN